MFSRQQLNLVRAKSFDEIGCTPDCLIKRTALRKPSKLEVENHVTGIYFPAPSHLLAGWRARLCRLCRHSGLQPVPEFFDAPRTFVRIAVLARRHLVRAPASAMS
jgi:hypothetical protein